MDRKTTHKQETVNYKYKHPQKEKNAFFYANDKRISEGAISKKTTTPKTKKIKRNLRKMKKAASEDNNSYLASINNINQSIHAHNKALQIIHEAEKQIEENNKKLRYATNALKRMHKDFTAEEKEKIGAVDYDNPKDLKRVARIILTEDQFNAIIGN